MNRTYDREWLEMRLAKIREVLPDCGISTDIIAGFCSETEEEHQDTLSLFKDSKFNFAFMYQYSERPGTLAARRYADDVPVDVKHRRLSEIIAIQSKNSIELNHLEIGKTHIVLIEGYSKRSEDDLRGRNDKSQVVIFPREHYQKGQYVKVLIERVTQTSLIGKVVEEVKF
jgi:tRNA-2-methylthio-N6-dimethylallyladenosine synthase